MTYEITDACLGTKDQSCIAVCPVDCIHATEYMFVIAPDECIDCGACEPECPGDAIFPSDACSLAKSGSSRSTRLGSAEGLRASIRRCAMQGSLRSLGARRSPSGGRASELSGRLRVGRDG